MRGFTLCSKISLKALNCFFCCLVLERIQRKTTLGVAKYALSQALGQFVEEEIETSVSCTSFYVYIRVSRFNVLSFPHDFMFIFLSLYVFFVCFLMKRKANRIAA